MGSISVSSRSASEDGDVFLDISLFFTREELSVLTIDELEARITKALERKRGTILGKIRESYLTWEKKIYIEGSGERYSITESGQIFVEPSGEEKRIFVRPNSKTLMVELTLNGRRSQYSVAKLVYTHFSDDYDPHRLIRHRDGDETNNHISNLFQEGPRKRTRQYRLWPAGRRVIIRETGDIYKNARLAADAIGGYESAVGACLRGELQSHMGYTFEYGDPFIFYNDRKFDDDVY